jgi:hypothetical protein
VLSPGSLALAQDPRGVVVGGQERLQVQFGECHVECGREGRERRHQLQLALVAAQPQRHREADVVAPEVRRRQMALDLRDERVEALVGVAQRLGAHVLEDVPPPLSEVLDARRHAVRMDRQQQEVQRRFE